MFATTIDTPVGRLRIAADGERLVSIDVGADGEERDDTPLLREATAQLRAYFENDIKDFDLPLAPSVTPRGEAHRAAIVAVGHGEVRGYGAIARLIGSSPRAVGQACRRNPFPIVVPCHRVVGAGGAIGHYSAGQGIATKRWLLAHERGDELWAS